MGWLILYAVIVTAWAIAMTATVAHLTKLRDEEGF